MRILGVILARGGSKGVPRKNIRPLGGLPLLGHTLRAGAASGVLECVVVSTEDPEIAGVSRSLGAEVVDRPMEFAQDGSKSEPALTHALLTRETSDGAYDAVMLLPPTCPFRGADHIKEAVALFEAGGFDTVLGLQAVLKYRYDWTPDGKAAPRWTKRANRQEREPVYVENGTLYLSSAVLVREGKIFGALERIGGVLMDEEASVNIDEPADFDMAEAVLRRRTSA